jgi:hypothetical protein
MSSLSRTFQGTFGMKWRQFLTRWGARIARFRDMGGRNLALKHCCHSSCRYSIGRAKEREGRYARPGAVKNPFLPEFDATHRKSPVLVRCPDIDCGMHHTCVKLKTNMLFVQIFVHITTVRVARCSGSRAVCHKGQGLADRDIGAASGFGGEEGTLIIKEIVPGNL